MIGRAAVAGPIDHIDLVAFFKKDCGPAATAVRSAHPVESLTAAAVHQHDRVRMPHFGGNLILDIHLFADDHGAGPTWQGRALDAGPEEAPLGDIKDRTSGGSSHSFRAGHQTGESRRYGQAGCDKIAACGFAHNEHLYHCPDGPALLAE